MPNFHRLDGRLNNSLRPQVVYLNPLKAPSCRIITGNIKNDDNTLTAIGGRTSVLAVLLNSTENRSKNSIKTQHIPYYEVFIRPSAGMIKSSVRSMEAILVKVMQRLIKSDKLEDSGSLLPVCLNALITCLMLSGIEINNLPYAATFGIVNVGSEEVVILDPTNEEVDSYCTSSVTLLCEPTTGDVSLVTLDSGPGGYTLSTLETMKSLIKNVATLRLNELNLRKEESHNPARITFEANKSGR